MAENRIAKTNVGDQVIARVENLAKVGFTCPPDYNFVNAIKASMLVLQELKDKNGKPALEVCTQASVASALFAMAVKGLSAANNTCYFICRGDKLCMHESYFGKALQVRRIYPNYEPHPVVVHEGDDFIYTIDPETGYKKLIKHEQKLENLDKDFVGAYMYIPTADGNQDLYIMSKKQILTAWSKSSSREMTTQKTFTEKMVGKTLVNSGLNMVINSTPDLSYAANENDEDEQDINGKNERRQITDFQEAEVIDETPAPYEGNAAKPEDGKDSPAEQPKPAPTYNASEVTEF